MHKAVESHDMALALRMSPTCRCFGLLFSGLGLRVEMTASPSLSLLLRTAALRILQCTIPLADVLVDSTVWCMICDFCTSVWLKVQLHQCRMSRCQAGVLHLSCQDPGLKRRLCCRQVIAVEKLACGGCVFLWQHGSMVVRWVL